MYEQTSGLILHLINFNLRLKDGQSVVAMRPVVSYEDITLPYQQPEASQLQSHPNKPPSKKRKWSNQTSKNSKAARKSFKNNDMPHVVNSLNDVTEDVESDVEEEKDQGRELTHDEIWGDSSLIDAWNAANEEYETYNGTEKSWKAEPVHKSAL